MYAIIEDSGTQIRASVGDTLTIDLREIPTSAKNLKFERVLMIGSDKGSKVGTPYVDGATVSADILEHDFKDRKIEISKYKRRKGYRRKQGHRQRYMKVKVTAING